jgi:hypothetical protein
MLETGSEDFNLVNVTLIMKEKYSFISRKNNIKDRLWKKYWNINSLEIIEFRLTN